MASQEFSFSGFVVIRAFLSFFRTRRLSAPAPIPMTESSDIKTPTGFAVPVVANWPACSKNHCCNSSFFFQIVNPNIVHTDQRLEFDL